MAIIFCSVYVSYLCILNDMLITLMNELRNKKIKKGDKK